MSAFLIICVLLTQLPSEVGPFRWPFRFLPPLAFAATALVCLSIAWVGLRVTRGRLTGSVLIIGVGTWIEFGRTPENAVKIALGSVVIGALLAALVVSIRRGHSGGLVGLVGAYLTAAMAVLALPAPGTNPDVPDFGYAPRISQIPETHGISPDTRAVVLRTPDQSADDYDVGVAVGFVPTYHDRFLGQSYAAVAQKHLANGLCTDYLGRVCPEAVSFLTTLQESTGQTWRDLLGYRDILVWKDLATDDLASGMTEVGTLGDYMHLRSTRPLPAEHVTHADRGVEDVRFVDESPNSLTYEVQTSSPGTLVLDQTWWPGWKATLDGAPLTVGSIDDILVSVDLPAGADGLLQVEYQPVPPTLITLLALAAAGMLAAAVPLAAAGERRGR
jgi:hypothetical protein